MSRLKKLAIMGVLAAVAIGTMSAGLLDNHGKYFQIAKNIEIFTNIYREINSYYVDEVEPARLMRTGVDAMMESLDPYTNYISESEIEGFKYMIDGKYGGIGAKVKKINGRVTVIMADENTPADKAGIKAGDIIKAIDGKSTDGKTMSNIDDIFKGSPGSEIDILIERVGSNKDIKVSITREEVKVPNVPYFGMVDDKVGYMVLTTFTQDAGKNLANALKSMKKENPGMEGVILDLRGNGGGLLREAVNICNLFVPKGQVVVETRGKVKDFDQVYRTLNSSLDEDIRLVVLIDNNSASASEIVSGVMQDLDRGVLIGQRSYGKGLVQNTRDVGYNSKLKLTTSTYYIPSGRCIQAVRYKDGEPVDVADSLRTAFKTQNGRKVQDGGGVKPDVILQDDKLSNVLRGLNKEHLIFRYATDFSKKNKTIKPAEEFQLENYADFMNFVADKSFSFDTQTEEMLKGLNKKAQEDGYYDLVKSDLKAVRDKILQSKKNDLKKYQRDITDALEKEIVGRYHYRKGQIEIGLRNDGEIKEAIKILKNPAEYNRILGNK